MLSRTYFAPLMLALAAVAAALATMFLPDAAAALLGAGPAGLLLASGAAVDLSKLGETLDHIADAFHEHKTASDQRIDRLEGKLARPGVMLGNQGAAAATESKGRVWTVNGQPARVLHGADEIAQHYAQRAADPDDDWNVRNNATKDGNPFDRGLRPAGQRGVQAAAFLKAVAGMSGPEEVRAVLNEGTDADGGYLVPSMLMGQVLSALVPESAVLQAGAGLLPLDLQSQGAKSFTLAAVDTTPTAGWRLENGAVVESSPGFRAVVMAPKSLAFYFKVSREWLADAAGAEEVLTQAIAQAFAKELDRVALRGSGSAPEPRGVLNTSGILAVGNGANGASLGTTKYANVFSAVQAILEANGPMPTAAVMSPRSKVTLGALADSTGQPLQVPSMLSKMNLLHTSQVPNNLTVGTSTDCTELYLGDFTKLVFALRERMSIAKLNEAFATSGQVGFICHVRADVGVTYPKAFAVATGVRA